MGNKKHTLRTPIQQINHQIYDIQQNSKTKEKKSYYANFLSTQELKGMKKRIKQRYICQELPQPDYLIEMTTTVVPTTVISNMKLNLVRLHIRHTRLTHGHLMSRNDQQPTCINAACRNQETGNCIIINDIDTG